MKLRSRCLLATVYGLATIQFVWSCLWLTRPYVNTQLYEQGRERMPFQGRLLMMLPMRWAHHSSALHKLTAPFARSHFWFPRPVAPEVLVQAAADVVCILIAGFLTARMYQASSRRQLLTPMVFPLFLVYAVLHTSSTRPRISASSMTLKASPSSRSGCISYFYGNTFSTSLSCLWWPRLIEKPPYFFYRST